MRVLRINGWPRSCLGRRIVSLMHELCEYLRLSLFDFYKCVNLQGPNQVVPKIENKTRLRQPTNWGTGSKPSAVISGIPRPASRIPALRFARPNNTKANQADLRKGCT